jgi:uncharacterized protein
VSTARRAAGTVLGAGAAALGYAVLVEPRWFALRHATVPVLRPVTARPLRVLHLSDLHLPPGAAPVHGFVRRCLAQRPDVVVLTGDVLGHADAIPPAVELLGDRNGAAGVIVLGSNDHYGPTPKNPLHYWRPDPGRVHGSRLDTGALVAGLEAAGWQVLENRRAALTTPAGPLDVAGLADPHIGRDAPERIDWTPPRGPVTLRLGVVHAPYTRALDVFDRHGYDLVLSGHTHGGQVRLPGVGALVANCDLPLTQARGLSRYGARLWLHVSAGTGQSRYAPLRFACRPEATLLDLVPRPD